MNELPTIPVDVSEEHVGDDPEYQVTVVVPVPEYVTVAVRDNAFWPISYVNGPGGETLTVGSGYTVTVPVFDAPVLPKESVTVK